MKIKPFLRILLLVGLILFEAFILSLLTFNIFKEPATAASQSLPAGPYLVKDIQSGEPDSFPSPLIPTEQRLYFFGHTDQGRNLWTSDGTEIGTYQVKDLNHSVGADPYPAPYQMSYPAPKHAGTYPEVVNNQLFFANDDGIHGEEIWLSNGSNSGTNILKDIFPGSISSSPLNLTNVNNQLFFRAIDKNHGDDLWLSQGTITNTKLVTDLVSVSYRDLVNFKDKAYFSANDGIHGWELWESNGTSSDTILVKDIAPGSDSTHPHRFYTTDSYLFFLANQANCLELWRSDGSPVGTIQLQDCSQFSQPDDKLMAATTQLLFFAGLDETNGLELWVSDGTADGTYLVKDIHHNGDSNLIDLFPVENRIFFFADDGTHGRELWVSDGSNSGTHLVKDIQIGAASSHCSSLDYQSMTYMNGLLFFAADDGEHGCELWSSDGTPEGTTLMHDINPGYQSSQPTYLSVYRNTVFFAADDGTHGNELWSLGNVAPKAEDDTAVIDTNISTIIPVLNNDTDLNLDELSVVEVGEPEHGTAAIDGATIVYTRAADIKGTDVFSYTIQDTGGLTAVAQISITITAFGPIPPMANDDVAFTMANQAISISVLENDSDMNMEDLSIAAVNQPPQGSAAIDGNNILYAPDENFIGTDLFSYTVNDPGGLTAVAQVKVIVTGNPVYLPMIRH